MKIRLRVINAICPLEEEVQQVVLRKKTEDITEERTVCYEKKIGLEPNLPPDTGVELLDNGGLNIVDHLTVVFKNEDLPETKALQ